MIKTEVRRRHKVTDAGKKKSGVYLKLLKQRVDFEITAGTERGVSTYVGAGLLGED